MNSAIAAHIRILETIPRECVRTHERSYRRDEALDRKRAGVRMAIPQEMLARYMELKAAKASFLAIKRELRVSTRTLARIRAMVSE